MIGYPISKVDLEALIAARSTSWLHRAAQRTNRFRAIGRYEEDSSIWSEVKLVYMELQGDCKCAYCERKLESSQRGSIEEHVDHFRPKGNVRAWEMPQQLKDQGIDATQVPNEDHGYYLLSYHLFNYAASCGPCNLLKRDGFPIAGDYVLTGEDPVDLLAEKPYLIYPIGDFDESPEDLIRFHGVSPQAVAPDGHRRARALVTIEFFELDHPEKRKRLMKERALVIMVLYPELEKEAGGAGGAEAADATRAVEKLTSASELHTNCARSFKRLFYSDRVEAKAVYDRARQFFMSGS